jgi:hypothetical protein
MGELPEETRLAHARLADHRDHLAVPQAGPIEGPAELLQLRVPADEAREPAPRRSLEAGAGGAGPHQLEHLDRLAEPLDGHRAEGVDLDEALGQVQGLGSEPRAARCRELLHTGREMGGLAHGGVVHAEIAADRPHHDLSRVDADADLNLHALLAAKLIRVAPPGVLHPERGVARPHRVILVCQRRAEQRHDAVTHHLVHGALVVMDGVHHQAEDRVDELARLLGIAVGEQLHGALEVGEEDRDLLALAFQRGLGDEDLLGQVLRRVALRGGEARPRLRWLGVPELGAAPVAEATTRWVDLAALGAGQLRRRAAPVAEAGALGILVLAPRTSAHSSGPSLAGAFLRVNDCREGEASGAAAAPGRPRVRPGRARPRPCRGSRRSRWPRRPPRTRSRGRSGW